MSSRFTLIVLTTVFLYIALDDWTLKTLPAGTELAFRIAAEINFAKMDQGKTYHAVTEKAVLSAGGTTLIPQGASAQLIVCLALEPPGLRLEVDSVDLDGTRFLLRAANADGIGVRGNSLSAQSALGTLLAAVTGEAQRGLGISAPPESRKVFPLGTILTFRLVRPVVLEPIR